MLTRKQLYRKTIKNFQSKNKLIEKNNRYTDSQIDSTNRNPMNFIFDSKETTNNSKDSIEKIKSIRFDRFVYVRLIPTKEEYQKYNTI